MQFPPCRWASRHFFGDRVDARVAGPAKLGIIAFANTNQASPEVPNARVEQARQEVQNQMQHAVELAASPTPRPAGEMKQALWTVLLGIGRALMALYFAGQAERWGLGRRYGTRAERSKWSSTRAGRLGRGSARLHANDLLAAM